MATNTVGLPEGFTLDAAAPPAGFKVDSQLQSDVRPDILQDSTPGQPLTSVAGFSEGNDMGVQLEQPSFLERLKGHADERTILAVDIYERFHKSEQGLASSAVQMVGHVGAGAMLDFLTESLITGGKQLVSALPDQIEDPLKRRVAEGGIAFLNTDVGKAGMNALLEGVEKYGEWAKENPVSAANFESIVNIALVLAPNPTELLKRVGATQAVTALAGRALRTSAAKTVAKTKDKFIEKLVTPKQTKTVLKEQIPRTKEGGLFNTGKVALTAAQKASAKELKTVPLQVNRSIQKNYEIIAKTVKKEADNLVKRLKAIGDDMTINKQALVAHMDDAVKQVLDDPFLAGSAESTVAKVIAMMRKELDGVGDHVSDILKARKNFDAKLISQGKEAVLDPGVANAATSAVRAARRAVNDFLNKVVKSVKVKKSLNRQHRLLNAMDDIAVKAADEANSAIGRVFQKMLYAVTLRNELNQFVGMALGIGGLGAAAIAAPWILGVGVTTGIAYKAGRMVMSPQTRQGLALLLEISGKSVTMTRQMRADRALIKEMLENAEIVPEAEVQ